MKYPLAFVCLWAVAFCATHAAAENLVPDTPCSVPNYWCTWSAQNYMFGQGAGSLDPALLEGGDGAQRARAAMNEQNMFGPRGWARTFYPSVRKDLFIVFDDGLFRDGMASFIVDDRKFPSLTGEPRERLRKLNEMTRALGWRGAALWCRGTPGGAKDEELVRWSQYAGITYWKVDGGDNQFHLIDVAKRLHPDLLLEHIQGLGPFNGPLDSASGRYGTLRWTSHQAQCLLRSDVLRSYDVSPALSLPTTLDRAAQLLALSGDRWVRGLINVEDEVYLAATLGCAMGVMRHPMAGLRPGGDPDPFFNCPRQCKRRMDEVVRAIHWQRLAAPYASLKPRPADSAAPQPGTNDVALDTEILTDSWKFSPGETWMTDAIGKTISQGAPARVARGVPLPEVRAEGDKPFVVAGRFPNGAVAVAVQGRTAPGRNWFIPPADVTVEVGRNRGPIGVFGRYRSLTLRFDRPLSASRILAQDLAGQQARDITDQVAFKDNTVTLPGALIARTGLEAATAGDLSDPGLVLVIRGR